MAAHLAGGNTSSFGPHDVVDGASFRQLRRQVGLSMLETAAIFGVTRTTIHNWEKNNTPLPRMAALAMLYLAEHRDEGWEALLPDEAGLSDPRRE